MFARPFPPLPLALVLVTTAFVPAAAAQLLAYDGFDNGPRADLHGSSNGLGWTAPWADVGTDPTTIAGNGLAYANLDTVPGAALTPAVSSTYPASLYQRPFPAPPAGTTTLYVSFLLRADANYGAWGGLSFGTYPYAMTVGAPPGMYAFGLMTSRGLGDITSRPLIQGETVLLVARISTNVSGPGVTYRLYLDPTVGAGEPANPDAIYGIAQVAALPTQLGLDNGTGFTTDEVRVGLTWDAVLPAQHLTWSDLGFAKPGVHGAPRLDGFGPLRANTPSGVTLTNANASAPAVLVLGARVVNTPVFGGVLVPDPAAVLPGATDPAGGATLQVLWPMGVPPGLPVVFQYWIADPAATFGLAASNGVQGLSQ